MIDLIVVCLFLFSTCTTSRRPVLVLGFSIHSQHSPWNKYIWALYSFGNPLDWVLTKTNCVIIKCITIIRGIFIREFKQNSYLREFLCFSLPYMKNKNIVGTLCLLQGQCYQFLDEPNKIVYYNLAQTISTISTIYIY